MIFTEPRFLLFFLAVFAVHWALGSNRSRKLWLLGVSYLFYAGWDWRFLSLIWLSTGVDYLVALRLAASRTPAARKRLVTLSLAVNLGLLGVFKYFDFFVDSAVVFLAWLGFEASYEAMRIVLPVGISFYTFQTLSYTLDVYRGVLEPRRSLLDVALFVAFFPQLVAGPIVRAAEFLPQLDLARRLAAVDVRRYLVLFLVGFVKKACIGDNVAVVADQYFAAPGQFDAVSAWIAVLCYAIQIYCDFSGYSDMAIASGGLLGFHLPRNFAFPYFARSIREFWRRWHISLSTWLRDYLYISLGGSRGGTLATYRNLMLTMLLGGLWHGAAWNFVLWGGLHGVALVAQRLWPGSGGTAGARRPLGWLSGPLTFYWVLLTWIFFRAEGLGEALDVCRAFVLWQDLGSQRVEMAVLGVIALFFVAHWIGYRGYLREFWRRVPGWAFASGYGVAVASVLPFVRVGSRPFIYFQF